MKQPIEPQKPNLDDLASNRLKLAECLACGMGVTEAGEYIGLSRDCANALMQRIRKIIGRSAV
jgi:hypothetical protein